MLCTLSMCCSVSVRSVCVCYVSLLSMCIYVCVSLGDLQSAGGGQCTFTFAWLAWVKDVILLSNL